MNDLYPGEKRDILEGFHLYRGKGEIFDLSVKPFACTFSKIAKVEISASNLLGKYIFRPLILDF